MLLLLTSFFHSFHSFLLTDFRDREEKVVGEREASICCSTYLCIHHLILVYTLTGDRTHRFSILRLHSNQLSYVARAAAATFKN